MESASFVRIAIGIVLDQRLLLITRRPDHTVLAGLWEFPGGKVEPDETEDQCVVRELREEVGLEVRVVASFTDLNHHYDHGRVRLSPRLCRVVSGQPRPLQVADLKWIDPSQLSDHRFPEANGPLLEAIESLGLVD